MEFFLLGGEGINGGECVNSSAATSSPSAALKTASALPSASVFTMALAGALLLILSGCTGYFFQPKKEFRHDPVIESFNIEDVYFKTPDGLTLHGWLMRPRQKSRGTILFLHGNYGNVSVQVNGVLWLVNEGYTVFAFDYRGYGRSEGSPTVEGVHVDAVAALEYALSIPGGGKFFVFGQSLGGAVAVHTVSNFRHKERISALVIESAFSSYRLIAREKADEVFILSPLKYPISYLVNDDYSPVKWAAGVAPVPFLIMHGKNDPVVGAHHASLIYEAAGQPKELWITQPDGHIYSFADAAVRARFLEFLSRF
jgi:hypothetical protein